MKCNESEIFSCEICCMKKRNDPTRYFISETRLDEKFLVCPEGHKLFPLNCDNCKSSWEGFVKDKNRILCLQCDYPVHVFTETPRKCEEAHVKIFEEAPGCLICTCCQSFELDLFILLPMGKNHVYFQCGNCSLEMVVKPKCSMMLTRLNHNQSGEGCTNSKSIEDTLSIETFLTAHISDGEFRKVLKVAQSRLDCLQSKYEEVSNAAGFQDQKRRHPKKISKLVEKLLADKRFHLVSKRILQKTPMVASVLIGLLVGAAFENAKVGENAALGCFVLLKAISDLLLAELESRAENSRDRKTTLETEAYKYQ